MVSRRQTRPLHLVLIASLFVAMLPSVSGADVHEQQLASNTYVNPHSYGLSGQVSFGQQLRTADYAIESTANQAVITKISLFLQKSTTSVVGNVCVRIRDPGWASAYERPCVAASSLSTSGSWIDFAFSGSTAIYAGQAHREFWVDYDQTCTTCVRVYHHTSDVYRAGDRGMYRQAGPEGSWAINAHGGDIAFKLWTDHSPIIRALRADNLGLIANEGYRYRMVIGITDNSQMAFDASFRWGPDLTFQNTEPNFTCLVAWTECWWEQPYLLQHQSYSFYACGYNYAGGQCTRQLTFNTPNVQPSPILDFWGPTYTGLGVTYFYGTATDVADTLLYEVDINGDNNRDCWTDYVYASGQTGEVPCNFSAGGTYNVRMRARDNSPNGGTPGLWTASRQIIVDATVPGPLNVHASTHLDSVWSSANDLTVLWDEVDGGGSGILGSRHRIDGLSYTGYSRQTSAPYADLSDGQHVVDVQVRDNAGNTGSGSFRAFIDTQPPSNATPHVKPGSTQGTNNWYTSAVQMEVVSADAGSGIACERYAVSASGPWLPTDDADLATCSGIADWAVPADGVYQYYGLAKDKLNQNRAAVDSLQVKMDRVAPTGLGANKTGLAGLNGWYKGDVTVSVNSTDATSQVACEQHRVVGSPAWLPVSCAGQDSFVHTAEGTVVYDVRAIDGAGLSTSATGVTVKLDKTPPSLARPVATGTMGSNQWYTSDVSFILNSTDATSGIACEQHGPTSAGPWTPADAQCTAVDSWTHNTEGSFTYFGRATDVAGWSRQGVESVSLKLDKTAPTVTDNQADKVWTNVNPTLNVDFGDARSGIWKVEYTVNTAAAQAGTVLLPFTTIFSTTTDGTGSYTNDWQASSGALRQGDNYISVRVTDRAGLSTTVNDVVKLQWDTVPPSKATPLVTTGTVGENSWYTSDVGLSIDSADATSPVATEWHGQILGQWFGGAPQDTWTDSSEGTDGWYGRAVDAASNEFISGVTPVKVDKTNPMGSVTTVGTLGNNGWYVSNVDATVAMVDTVSGSALIGTKLDAGAWTTVAAASKALQVSGDGIHSLSYYGKDFAGRTNASQAAPHIASIKIDRSGPVSTHSFAGTLGANGWYTSSVVVNLAASDATSGHGQLWSSVDGGSWQSTTASSLAVSLATAGTHTVNYYAVDLAGNADGSQAAPHQAIVKIDLANPSSSRALQGTTGTDGWYTTPVTVTLTGSDATSGVSQLQYGLDPPTAGTTPSVYGGPFAIGTEGVHELNHRALDNSGRLQAIQPTQVKVDLAAPDLSGWVQTPADVNGSQSAPVTARATVAFGPSGASTVRFRYSYDNGALWSAWTAATAAGGALYDLSIPPPGAGWWNAKDKTLRYEVNAIDGAGNQVTVTQTDFVQRLAPAVAMTSPANGQNLGNGLRSIQWTGQDLDRDTVTYTVRLSSDGGATFPTTIYTTAVNEDGTLRAHSYTWDTRSVADGGNYAIRIDANDGQNVVTQQRLPLRIDNTVPTVTMVTPKQGMVHVQGTEAVDPLGETRVIGTTTLIEASADDLGSGVAFVQFRIDGSLKSTDSTPDGAGLYSYTWASTAAGKHSVAVQAYDAAGNPSARFYRDVTVVESQAKPPAVPSASQVTGTVLGAVGA